MNKADKVKVAGEIACRGYKLYCWKVRNGSAVRAGSRFAIRKETSSSSNGVEAPVDSIKEDSAVAVAVASASNAADNVQHKRPHQETTTRGVLAVATDNPPPKT
jgi:hypothetical protein